MERKKKVTFLAEGEGEGVVIENAFNNVNVSSMHINELNPTWAQQIILRETDLFLKTTSSMKPIYEWRFVNICQVPRS